MRKGELTLPRSPFPKRKEVRKIPTSEYGGLLLFNTFWECMHIDHLIDEKYDKKSGASAGKILKNVTLGHIFGHTSLTELADENYKEALLRGNCQVSRSTYSRTMDAFNHNKQNTILLYLVLYLIEAIRFSEKTRKNALGIIDASVIEVTGETFADAAFVFDNRKGHTVWGYEIMTLLIKIGEHHFPFQFRVNDFTKEGILLMVRRMQSVLGISHLCFDGGIRGMEFYKMLEKEGFVFTTKATKNWFFQRMGWQKPASWWNKMMRRFQRNQRYVSKEVTKDGLKLLLVVAKGDDRIFLTNNLDAIPKDVYEIYKQRWSIEEMFRETKLELGFEKLTVRKRNAIRTHVLVVFLAYIFCQLVLSKWKSIKGVKLLIRKVFKHMGKIVYKAGKLTVRFLRNFKEKRKLLQLLKDGVI